MPNWCFTRYVIQSSDPKDIEALKAKLDELNQMPEPLLPNGFGNLWLGNIVHLLGGDWKKVYCRGRILDYELSDGNLHLSVESAWNEMNEVRELLLTKHPELDIFYMSEEGGMGIFITNDSDGRFFPERYILDTESVVDLFLFIYSDTLFGTLSRMLTLHVIDLHIDMKIPTAETVGIY